MTPLLECGGLPPLLRLATRRVGIRQAGLALFSSTMLMFGCAIRRTTHDYMFNVTGVVKAEDDVPLQGVDVTLEVNGPVYEAIDLVKTRHALTSDTGAFVFAYISHERGVQYTVTVRKEGFEPDTVSGAAPPNGNHVIRLKRLGNRPRPVTNYRT